ncbi:MAG TPA: FKBP-type peptidyl-prolyl cis-trans isomerase [Candidatus Dojkabacteria bacterium]|nr:FKBP-type peptidyl-prolyl cis-trans isomerase [Candidatus Dojkabacteria bacterium]
MKEKKEINIIPVAIALGVVSALAVVIFVFLNKEVDTLPDAQTINLNSNKEDTMNESNVEDFDVLGITTIQQGDGQEAQVGDTVSVHYEGTLSDGTKFDSSYDRGQPFEFTLGDNYVIEGWEKGVVGMKVGEIRELKIPSSMGYGESGNGIIPGNAGLIFKIELLEIK